MAVPFEVEELDHVVLRCRDQDRMLDFYVRILGLTEERRLEAIGLIQLRAGRSLVDLVPDTGGAPREHPNVDHLCLAIATPRRHPAPGRPGCGLRAAGSGRSPPGAAPR